MFSELKTLFTRYKQAFNLFNRLDAAFIGNMSGVNQLKRQVPIIVTLSSDEGSFKELELSLYSIFNQKVSPDRVILWLRYDLELNQLPYFITRYVKNGLEIKFVQDKKSYTKIIYTLLEYKNSIIVTADDNIYYPRNWLKTLYHSYITNPEDIHAHRAVGIKINDKHVSASRTWDKFVDEESTSLLNIPLSVGGVLYPPNCFTKDIVREDIFLKKLNIDWDIWAWAIGIISGRKFRVVKNHIKKLSCNNFFKQMKKELDINKNSEDIDKNIQKLMEYYGQNIYHKILLP